MLNKDLNTSGNYRVLPPFLDGNTFSINAFLLLCLIGFFIVGIDLSTELAREKNEVNFVLDNIEDSCNIPQLSPRGLDSIVMPLVTYIPSTGIFISSDFCPTSISDRGPPAVS